MRRPRALEIEDCPALMAVVAARLLLIAVQRLAIVDSVTASLPRRERAVGTPDSGEAPQQVVQPLLQL